MMKLTDFPDQPSRPGALLPPATISNVARLLDHHEVRCRYNEVKKRIEIDIPGRVGTLDNQDNVSLTHIVSLASQAGMPTGLVAEYVTAVADQRAYNPVADWIACKPWDGQDRLAAFYDTVTARDNYPPSLKETLLLKWLRSAAAAAMMPTFRGRGVLTLQGEQGLGKTTWVKRLVSDADLADSVIKLDHHLDAGNKDSILGAVTNWIVEIGELDSSFKRDVARLKGFLTADADRVRRPYDRRESEYRRRTVFVATVNEANFLVDQTGNSRWWTIPVTSLDYQHNIDMQQVFAQVAKEVRRGEAWWLTDGEEAALAECNGHHLAVSAIEELLSDRLDQDRIGAPGVVPITASETLQLLGFERPTNPQARECGAALRRHLGEPRRIKGADRWRVPIREGTAADLLPHGRKPPSKVVTTDEDDEIY